MNDSQRSAAVEEDLWMDDSQRSAAVEEDLSMDEKIKARNRLHELYETREYADLEIVCGTKTFKVHGFLVSPRSKYFRAVFFGGFKEAREKRVSLPDDPFLIVRLIRCLYGFDYPDDKILARPEGSKPGEKGLDDPYNQVMASADENGTEGSWTSRANTNVKMYAIADKYGFTWIKELAVIKVGFDVDYARESYTQRVQSELLKEIPLVYDTTLDTDRGMRDAMLEYVKKDWVRLSETEELLDAFAQAPVFGIEMVTAMNPTTLYKGTCRACRTRTPKWTAERVRCICGRSESVAGGNDPPKRSERIFW